LRENSIKLKNELQKKSRELGFESIGFSEVTFLKKDAGHLQRWLEKGANAEMQYMENHFEKRTNPALLIENAKTVISLTYNYFPKKSLPVKNNYKISKYAYGKDYHDVLKKKLWQLIYFIREQNPEIALRAFVDSAPVLDKAWAERSGLGWIGKNTLLIQPQKGSFYFIGEIIMDYPLPPDEKSVPDYCGKCTRCIDACPTAALTPYHLDANRCISYLTIENKGEIPPQFKGKMEDWIFGCDICQDVCPFNIRFATPHSESAFEPHIDLLKMNKSKWNTLSKEDFDRMFVKSPVKRTKYEGLMRNIKFVKDER
jgi:epoxyqueuosine reductase